MQRFSAGISQVNSFASIKNIFEESYQEKRSIPMFYNLN
jgi:hypothetical protein